MYHECISMQARFTPVKSPKSLQSRPILAEHSLTDGSPTDGDGAKESVLETNSTSKHFAEESQRCNPPGWGSGHSCLHRVQSPPVLVENNPKKCMARAWAALCYTFCVVCLFGPTVSVVLSCHAQPQVSSGANE